MAELKLAGEIARYGILGAPALMIDEKIVSAGSVPHKSKIREWLQQVVSMP